MQKPNNYDTTQAAGEFEPIKLGGHKMVIKQVSESENISVVDAMIKVYNSFISPKIDDYNSSVYYENPSYIYECYRENKML